ncbi:MAG: beta-1,4-galactosyltransferase [Nitrososphaerota archaeon]|nr:beta-1,4-galactosyltransferase [Nitrososphaerota archaeon]
MDYIAGHINEEVIMQIGETKYHPKHAKYFDFTSEQEIKELCRRAGIVVTHGGVGMILDALQEGVPVIVVPRLKKYGEVIDDHQLSLARELEKGNKVTVVYNIDELEAALEEQSAKQMDFVRDRRLVDALKKYIAQFDRNS